ncbi:hypothetical protein [Methanobacterium sp. SMA-27]|uniref:hypothetical protein n=1 Tax=Methanobacterium sp. SMA-27 TaxID=1495336 RepID=UPI00064FA518|nr:hypothetical protein [Methanobacterium sp. SMA-27]
MKDLKNERMEILRKIKHNDPLKSQFFRELSKTTNPFPWLEDLIIEGYFDPEGYPSPEEVSEKKGYYTIPYWDPSGYLENISKLNYLENDDKTTELLIDIIENYINYPREERNYRIDYVFLKAIFYLPKEKITSDHINFISKAINSDSTLIELELFKIVMKKLLDYKFKDFLLELLEIILDYKKESKQYLIGYVHNEYVSIMDEFWLNKNLEDSKPFIAEFCALDAFKISLKKISDIVDEDKFQFDYVSIPTIEDHPQSMFPEEYKFQLVHFARDMIEYLPAHGIYSEEIRICTENLAANEKKIFRRIAIYIIDLYYDELNEIFWNWIGNPLDEIDLRHDIYRFFKLNYSKFDDDKEKIDLIIDWVDNNEYIRKLESEGADLTSLAYQKLRWFLALDESKNQKIQSLIREYRLLYPHDIEHPDFGVWTSEELVGVDTRNSENLCKKDNQQLADYLNNFTSESIFEQSDLSESFIKCVSDHPEKFTNNLLPFLNVSRKNQYNLIYGLQKAWSSEKTFNCIEIFDFIKDIIINEKFWNEESDGRNYKNSIVSVIADFIEKGTEDDRFAFDRNLLKEAGKILLIIVDNAESDLQEMDDLITSVLNSSLGKIFSAMVVYSLKCLREYGNFPQSIRIEFEKRFNNPPIELSVTLGRYLSNLCALDKDWVNQHINLIFPDNIEIWKHAFMGYLFYSTVIYTDIYNLLKNEYIRAIKTDFNDRKITHRLIQHIGHFYLKNDEDLNDPHSLISKLIIQRDPIQISLLIHFILANKQKINVGQIKPLWLEIIAVFPYDEDTENCKILAKLSRWLELIETIDSDVYSFLILSAKCIESQPSISIFIKNLTKHVEKSPKEVGEIFLELIKKTPEHKKEDIIQIVDVLFQKEQTDIANYICNEYRIKHLDFLIDIHDKYNQRALEQ